GRLPRAGTRRDHRRHVGPAALLASEKTRRILRTRGGLRRGVRRRQGVHPQGVHARRQLPAAREDARADVAVRGPRLVSDALAQGPAPVVPLGALGLARRLLGRRVRAAPELAERAAGAAEPGRRPARLLSGRVRWTRRWPLRAPGPHLRGPERRGARRPVALRARRATSALVNGSRGERRVSQRNLPAYLSFTGRAEGRKIFWEVDG